MQKGRLDRIAGPPVVQQEVTGEVQRFIDFVVGDGAELLLPRDVRVPLPHHGLTGGARLEACANIAELLGRRDKHDRTCGQGGNQ
jgi:hypothetical protein